MKRHAAVVAVVVSILGGCIEQSSTTNEVGITPTDVGTTPDSSTGLKLASGVNLQVLEDNGFVLRVQYVRCFCGPGLRGSCSTASDNPSYPSCSGGCFDSEGRSRGCSTETMIGPPRTPYPRLIRFLSERPSSRARKDYCPAVLTPPRVTAL